VRPALVQQNTEPATTASDRVVKHHRQKLFGALRSADTKPKKLHKARLKVKVLRYLLEHGLPEGRLDPELKLLRRLQACLGELHDNENVLAALRERHRHRDGMHDLCSRLEAHKSRNLHSFKKQKKSLMRRWRGIA
jgi:CHAD domain-containing protein